MVHAEIGWWTPLLRRVWTSKRRDVHDLRGGYRHARADRFGISSAARRAISTPLRRRSRLHEVGNEWP